MATILHTSDWHIGRVLHGAKRYEEWAAFLNWLLECLVQEQVDVLLVAGDIFDTIAPSHKAQELYYGFLHKVLGTPVRHVVVIAGNHDSSAFLNAPQALLQALHIHVVGSPDMAMVGVAGPTSESREVLVLRDKAGQPELIVCAVPYLRDRDMRTYSPGESMDDKDQKLVEGIAAHYAAVGQLASQVQAALEATEQVRVPIIGMGHLFAAGSHLLEEDGVRDLYVGSLAQVGADIFPACFDYVALGHVHTPQKVMGNECIRYCGAPLAMGFGEAGQGKSLCLLRVQEGAAEKNQFQLSLLPVPVFQSLVRLQGDWNTLHQALLELVREQSSAWLDISYTGAEVVGNLRERLDEVLAGSALRVLRARNRSALAQSLRNEMDTAQNAGAEAVQEDLIDLNVHEVFTRCLEAHKVPEEQRAELRSAYGEIVRDILQGEARQTDAPPSAPPPVPPQAIQTEPGP